MARKHALAGDARGPLDGVRVPREALRRRPGRLEPRRGPLLAPVPLAGAPVGRHDLGELPGVVEVEIFRHGPLPERGGERSLLRVIVTFRRGSLGALGSFTIAVHARAADGAGEPLDVHEVPQADLAEDEQKPGEKCGVDV